MSNELNKEIIHLLSYIDAEKNYLKQNRVDFPKPFEVYDMKQKELSPIVRGLSSSEQVLKLTRYLSNIYDQQTFGSLVLLGPYRSGKKECLLNAAINNQVESFISIEGNIFDHHVTLTQLIETYTQSSANINPTENPSLHETKKNKSTEQTQVILYEEELDEQQNTKFQTQVVTAFEKAIDNLFRRHTNEKKTVVYIELSSFFLSARQTILYSIYDKICQIQTSCLLVMSSDNFLFYEKLDKRVKSRFSGRIFYFGESNNQIDKFVSEILNQHTPENNVFFEELKKIILSPSFLNHASLIYELSADYSRVVRLLKSVMHVLLSKNKFGGVNRTYFTYENIHDIVEKAKTHITGNVNKFSDTNFSKQHMDVLECIRSMAQYGQNDDALYIKDIYQNLKVMDSAVFSTHAMIKINWHNFFAILRDLHEARYIRIKYLPISFHGSFVYLGTTTEEEF